MGVGLCDQIERNLQAIFCCSKPWKVIKNSHKWSKAMKHRRERFRARRDPECMPMYRRYKGYEF